MIWTIYYQISPFRPLSFENEQENIEGDELR